MRIRTHYNRTEDDVTIVFNHQLSVTVPNLSYTIEELFEMHKRNIRLPIEEYFPEFDELDLEDFNPRLQDGEDIIDWYNRLSDNDRRAIIDTLASGDVIASDPKESEDTTRGVNERQTKQSEERSE